MLAKTPPRYPQGSFLYPDLIDQLNPKHPLLQLARRIPWETLEKEFSKFYALRGRPAKPVRLMVGLLLLKQLKNMSDEHVVQEWVSNPYYQAFCGIKEFQWKFPCEPSDLVHFRKRIGEEGVQKIFQMSIELNKPESLESEIVVDTTVQEKNVTFPTDTKLRVKVILRCLKLAEQYQIRLRRTYRREFKGLLRIIRFKRSSPRKQLNKAKRRIKTIANALLRELERKLPEGVLVQLKNEFDLWKKAVNQEKNDKDKIYSLHEPQTACIAKGKEHKKYEFGAKAALGMTKDSGILVGAVSFSRNEYDGKTLPTLLSQIKVLTGQAPETAYCDRGFRGNRTVLGTEINIPDSPKAQSTLCAKQKARKNFGRRCAIEPVIGHLKNDFRLARNYLKGTLGDTINLLLAASAYNLNKWLRRAAACALNFILFIMFPWLAPESSRKIA